MMRLNTVVYIVLLGAGLSIVAAGQSGVSSTHANKIELGSLKHFASMDEPTL
jgi:hypothetical protein